MILEISKPIWDGRKIGVASFRLYPNIDLEIRILYTNKEGERIHPHTYLLNQREALDYPRQVVKGVELVIVPIEELRVKNQIKGSEQ